MATSRCPRAGTNWAVPRYPRFRDGGETADGTFPAPNRSPRTVQAQAKKLERLGRHGTPIRSRPMRIPLADSQPQSETPSPGLLRFLNCPSPLRLRPLSHSAVHFWLKGERGETPCTHKHTQTHTTRGGFDLFYFILFYSSSSSSSRRSFVQSQPSLLAKRN